MSWADRRVSFSNLNTFKKCKRAFNMSMLRMEQTKHPNIIAAAEFGDKAETFWDRVFEQRWFFKTDEEVTELFETALFAPELKLNDKDREKISAGFWGCLKGLRTILKPGYKLSTQDEYKLEMGEFISSGRLDYYIEQPEPLIIDAKGTYKKDPYKSVGAQLLHYAWFNWRAQREKDPNNVVVPRVFAFYIRVGAVQEVEITLQDLEAYDEWLLKEHAHIQVMRLLDKYPATENESCFACGYGNGCPAYSKPNYAEKQAQNRQLVIDSLFADAV